MVRPKLGNCIRGSASTVTTSENGTTKITLAKCASVAVALTGNKG